MTLTTAGDFRALTPDVALCLFRVTQEALGNIVRHARGDERGRRPDGDAGRVGLSVTDNGVGFVTTDRTRHGLGLRSMDERVRLAKGTVTVKSAPRGRDADIVRKQKNLVYVQALKLVQTGGGRGGKRRSGGPAARARAGKE